MQPPPAANALLSEVTMKTCSCRGNTVAAYPVPEKDFIKKISGRVVDESGNGIGYACDMGITKFSADGTQLIYSTYLGGNDNETPHSLVVDP